MPATPHRLAFWTWLLPLPLLHLATWLSLATQFSDGAALWYLPFALALGLVLVLWWGPRVLVAVYINALVSIPLWGLAWQWAPLYAISETLGIALAWFLLKQWPFDPALPDVSHLLRLMLLGVLLPAVPMAIGVQANLWLTGHLPFSALASGSLTLWLADSLTALALSVPVLVYLTPWMRRRGWLQGTALQGAHEVAEVLRQLPPVPLLLLLGGMPWLLNLLPLTLNLPLLGVMTLGLALVWGGRRHLRRPVECVGGVDFATAAWCDECRGLARSATPGTAVQRVVVYARHTAGGA